MHRGSMYRKKSIVALLNSYQVLSLGFYSPVVDFSTLSQNATETLLGGS